MGKLLRYLARLARVWFVQAVDSSFDRYRAVVSAGGAIEAQTEVGPDYLVRHAMTEHFAGLPQVEDPEARSFRRRWNRERGAA